MAHVDAVIETPGGTRNKFDYDEKLGVFRLHKILPLGSVFPYYFGFIPETLADDGDPIDVMVLGEQPTFTGCVVGVRLIGVLEARQKPRAGKGKGKDKEAIRNDRLIAVPEGPLLEPKVRSIDQLPDHVLREIEHFFIGYNRYEGRKFKVLGRKGPRSAVAMLERAQKKFARAGKGQGA
jgi:inorganic pyrophosphatase